MSDIRLIQYTDKSIAIIGNSKCIKEKIQDLGGKPNWNLLIEGEKMFGWIFSLKSKDAVIEMLNDNIDNFILDDISESGEKSIEATKQVISAVRGAIAENRVMNEAKDITLPKVKEVKEINIAELDFKRHTKNNLMVFMTAHIDDLRRSILGEMNIKSMVMTDTSMLPDDGKRYLFLGGGCGFSHIKYDGRSKLSKQIVEDSEAIKKEVEKKMLKTIDKEYLKKLEKSGNPIQAHLFQNLSYKSRYNGIVVRYMERFFNLKNISIKNHDD